MLGFPLPYEGELVYSIIARHGVHSGITSPKELLQEVFGNTKIIATTDLHGHLTQISRLYPSALAIPPLVRYCTKTLYSPYTHGLMAKPGDKNWLSN